VKAGFQHEPAEDVTPIKLEEPLKSIPEPSVEVMHNQADFFLSPVYCGRKFSLAVLMLSRMMIARKSSSKKEPDLWSERKLF